MATQGRKYQYRESHPWLEFVFNAKNLDYESWMLLGEAKSKCMHISGAPLLPEIQKELMHVFLVKGALATTAIEGNTLTEEEVDRRIKGKLDLPPSKEYLGKEIDNVVKAYNEIGHAILDGAPVELSVDGIKRFNKVVLDGLPLKEDVTPGEIREYSVGVANYRGAPPEDCEYLLERYIQWLNNEFIPPDGQELIFGILKAILAHLYFVWIHPFGDGNGRTARLIEFQILLSVGVPAASSHLISNHYNTTRSEYYRQLEFTSKSGGNIFPFIKYALQGFVDGLKEQIDLIQRQQLFVHWINHIYHVFDEKDRTVDKRRRTLILELSNSKPDINIEKIRHVTPKIAEMYADFSDKTIQRDLEKLEDLRLVVKDKNKVNCNWELMRAFMTRIRSADR